MIRCFIFLIAAFSSGIVSGYPDHRAPVRKPNVIFILSDDQGTLDLNIYGAKDLETPNLDKLAKQGVRFTQFYAAAPVCSPSRAALLTGKVPQRAGLTGNAAPGRIPEGMPTEQFTMAEMLKSSGYVTGHIGKWHLGYLPASRPNGQGFDYSFGHMVGCIDNYSHYFYWDGPNRHDLWRNGKEVWYDGKFFPDLLNQEATTFIEQNKAKPFFLYLALNYPHYPMQGSDKWRLKYKDLPRPRRDYAAAVSTMDEKIGEILQKLTELKLRENTIIVFMSDHGHSTEERAMGGAGFAGPFRGAKACLFEAGLRVPAIISWPGHIPENQTRHQAGIATDWFPTIAELCGTPVSPASRLDGKSLVPVITGNAASPHKTLHWAYEKQWVVRDDDWKLLGNPVDKSNKGKLEPRDTLFLVNLAKDSSEMKNYATEHPDVVRRLRQLHEEWTMRLNSEAVSLKTNNKPVEGQNWFEKSIFMLHEDHHIKAETEVGKNADPQQTARIIALSKPDAIQIHAKGRPGYASYPTKIGWMAPKYQRDVLKVWRDVARKEGYNFSIYYNLGRDAEIQIRKPQWNRLGPEGKLQDAALCYHSGVAKEYLWPMIAEIMDNYRPDGLWFDGSVFTIKNCYCNVCKARFLAEKGMAAPTRHNQPGWAAYKDMQRQVYREFLYETVDRIKQKDPKCLVTINLAYSLHMPEKPYPGIDYFTADFGNEIEELSQEAHWYDNQGKPFEIMTTVHLDGGSGKGRQPKPARQLEQEMATIIANGGRYNCWDNPDSKSAISEEMGKHLRDVVSPFLRTREPWLLQTTRVPDVSILYSATERYAASDTMSNAFPPATNFIAVTDKIWNAGLNYEIIPEYKLAAGDIQSKVLIIENPAALSESNIKALRKYTESGGTILVTGRGLMPDKMQELLGISDIKKPLRAEELKITVNKQLHSFTHLLYHIKTKNSKVLLNATDAQGTGLPLLTSNVVGKGRAFAVMVPLLSQEKGGPYKVPAALISRFFEQVLPVEQRLLTTSAPAFVETVLRKKDNMHILHLVNHAEGERELIKTTWHKYYKISNIPPVETTHVSIRLPARPASVKLQPQNQVLQGWEYSRGRLEADVPGFAIHQMVVVE